MTTTQNVKKCKRIRTWLANMVGKYSDSHMGWAHRHVANCPRCQRRLAAVGKVDLALSLLKSEPHKLDLLMRANNQAVGVLRHSLRDDPKAQELKAMMPKPTLIDKCGKYKHPATNVAACFVILLMAKIGVFCSMEHVQSQGRNVVKHYYASHVGKDLADEIFTA
ncbi:MAG: hypothetical protein JSU70_12955 [Phycisphaerales bacterium]|nr:MAG: hypothetical protein JSU70_12955 [Phycisphaerales bacterium]